MTTTTRKRYSLRQVKDIVDREGLAEAITEYIDAEGIDDTPLSRAWAKARVALDAIEEAFAVLEDA